MNKTDVKVKWSTWADVAEAADSGRAEIEAAMAAWGSSVSGRKSVRESSRSDGGTWKKIKITNSAYSELKICITNLSIEEKIYFLRLSNTQTLLSVIKSFIYIIWMVDLFLNKN